MKNFQSFPFNKNELSLVTYNAILQNPYENIYFKDLDSNFILLSMKQAKYLGLDRPEEALGKSDKDFFSAIHAKQAYNDEQRIIASGEPILNAIEIETWDSGSSNYVITSKYPLRDESGSIIGTWGHSITLDSLQHSKEGVSLKAMIEETVDTSSTSNHRDPLTNLPNAKAFFNAMNMAYQKSMNQLAMADKDHALIMIDIEGFHTINEDLGHKGGNSALIFIADLLESAVGSRDNIYMYGTNSFAILHAISNRTEAISLSKEIIRLSTIEIFQHNEEDMTLLLNIGLCTFREVLPLGTIYDIINLADGRLAEAKKSGPNAIIFERK